jgi:uncharacterized protein (DUF2461 family)
MKPIFEDSKNFNCQDLYLLTVGTSAGREIYDSCHEIAHLLIKKNIAYGNSALEPVRVFSKANAREQLHVRIDDKLSRIMRGTEYVGDNDIDDLIGYLILLKIAKSKELEKMEAYGYVD